VTISVFLSFSLYAASRKTLCMDLHFLTKICLGPGDFILAVIRTDLHCHLEVTVAQQGRFGTKSTVSQKLCILTINNNSNHLQLTRKKTSNYSLNLNLMSKRSVLCFSISLGS